MKRACDPNLPELIKRRETGRSLLAEVEGTRLTVFASGTGVRPRREWLLNEVYL